MFIPIDIRHPKENFYLHQNVLTALLYGLLSFVTLILVTFDDKYYVTIPDIGSQDNQFAYQLICWLQVGALAIGVGAAYLIAYTI